MVPMTMAEIYEDSSDLNVDIGKNSVTFEQLNPQATETGMGFDDPILLGIGILLIIIFVIMAVQGV